METMTLMETTEAPSEPERFPPPDDGYSSRSEAITDGLRELEDLAVVELPDGTRYVDRKLLHAIHREQAERCRVALGPFITWMIRRRGLSAKVAELSARRVYYAMWASSGKPLIWAAQKAPRRSITLGRLACLSAYGTYLTEEGSDKDKEWARVLLLGLAGIRERPEINEDRPGGRGRGRASPGGVASSKEALPYSEEERLEILAAIERWHRRFGLRCPWLRPIARLHWIGCPFAQREAVTRLERRLVVDVLRELPTNKAATLPLWSATKGQRMLIAGLVKKELEDLVNWPAPWGTLADLIDPTSRRKHRHASAAATRLVERQKELLAEAQVDVTQFYYRWPATMKKVAWDKYHDWTLLSAYTGLDLQNLRATTYLRGEADGLITIAGKRPASVPRR